MIESERTSGYVKSSLKAVVNDHNLMCISRKMQQVTPRRTAVQIKALKDMEERNIRELNPTYHQTEAGKLCLEGLAFWRY